MSARELVVLGTAGQVPTRHRNHNGYLLRWDSEGVLFDPGEGTQRQMLHAGVSAHAVTRICVTHFHGDHCLGLAGVIQRLSLDRVPHPVIAHYPAGGQVYFDRLRHAAAFHETVRLDQRPAVTDGVLDTGPAFTVEARALSHPVETFGYRLTEPEGRRMLPARLAAHGIGGPDVGRLLRDGAITAPDGRRVTVRQVSERRPGQSFAFVMDTRMCEAVEALADGVDMLVAESTFLAAEAALAAEYGHLTAAQAARAAAAAGVRHLVLTHFSQRYTEPDAFLDEARAHFGGEITVARDLARIPVPRRR